MSDNIEEIPEEKIIGTVFYFDEGKFNEMDAPTQEQMKVLVMQVLEFITNRIQLSKNIHKA